MVKWIKYQHKFSCRTIFLKIFSKETREKLEHFKIVLTFLER